MEPEGGLPGTTAAAWTAEEQSQLLQLHAKFSADGSRRSHMELVLLVASHLPGRTARDVALRLKWLDTQQQQDLQRKRKTQQGAGEAGAGLPLSPAAGKKGQGRAAVKKEQGGLSLRPATSLSMPLAASSRHGSSGNLATLVTMGNTRGPGGQANGTVPGLPPPGPGAGPLPFMYPSSSSGNAAGGNSDSDGHVGMQLGMDTARMATSEPPPPLPPPIPIPPPGSMPPKETTALLDTLLEHCCAVLGSIRHNMGQCKVVENMELLVRYRDTLVAMLQHMGAMPGVMQQMPPLPVQPNLEMAARVLPPVRMGPMMGPGMLPMMPTGMPPMMGPMPMPPGPYPQGPYPFPTGPPPGFPGGAPVAPGPYPYACPPPPFMPPAMPMPGGAPPGSDPASGGLTSDSGAPPGNSPFGFAAVAPFPPAPGSGMGMGLGMGMSMPSMPMPFPTPMMPTASQPLPASVPQRAGSTPL